jgi:hypothetical protein
MIDQGLEESSIENMRQGLAARRATGTELIRPHLLAQIAEALSKARKTEEGLRVLEEALKDSAPRTCAKRKRFPMRCRSFGLISNLPPQLSSQMARFLLVIGSIG